MPPQYLCTSVHTFCQQHDARVFFFADFTASSYASTGSCFIVNLLSCGVAEKLVLCSRRLTRARCRTYIHSFSHACTHSISFSYYDSLDIDGASQVKVVRRFLMERLGPVKWTRGPRPRCWKQRNLNDCGVHVCRTAFLLTTGNEAAIDVDSAGDTSRFRRYRSRLISDQIS